MSKKHIWKILFVLCALLGILFCCVHYGLRVFLVITGSMEPAIPVRSLVFSRKIDVHNVDVGKVIVFNDLNNKRITAHRVIASGVDEYITKGDANYYKDRFAVKPLDILGEVVIVIPLINFFTIFMHVVFLVIVFSLGVLIRKFLLFLIKYGVPYLPTLSKIRTSFYGIYSHRRPKTFGCGR